MATSIRIQENTVTDTSISVSFIVSVTYAATYCIHYRIESLDGDGYYEEFTSSNFALSAGGSTDTPYKKFTGLTAGCNYLITAQLWNATTGTNLGVEDSLSVQTTGSSVVIDIAPWTWDWSNGGDATNLDVTTAYQAITTHGPTTNFSYDVWNDLCSKTREALEAVDHTWNTRYASYNATRMSTADKTLTAVRFNSLRYNIDRYSPATSGLSTVSPGDLVYGYYFTALTDSLNAYIESINTI